MEKTNLAFAILAIAMLTFGLFGVVSAKENGVSGKVVKLSENSGSGNSEDSARLADVSDDDSDDDSAMREDDDSDDDDDRAVQQPTEQKPIVGRAIYSYVEVFVEPEKQYSENGKARYEITIKDYHKLPDCVYDDVSPCSVLPEPIEYKLSFNSNHGMQGEFEEDKIILTPGGKKTTVLYVQTDNRGANVFEVTASGRDAKSTSRGLLIVGLDEPRPEPTSFFDGKGFALESKDGESAGYLAELHLINNEGLEGKMRVGEGNFRALGTLNDDKIELKLISVNSGKGGDETTEGTFVGEVDKFREFTLVRGTLKFDEKEYEVTLMDNRNSAIKVVDSSDDEAFETKVDEAIVIQDSDLTESVIVSATEIVDDKFLGIFPTGKSVKVKVTEGDKTYEYKFKENSENKVGSRTFRVGEISGESATISVVD